MTWLFFLASILALLLALFVACGISLGDGLDRALKGLTKKMGPGVVHTYKPASYWSAYLLLVLALGLLLAGIYQLVK